MDPFSLIGLGAALMFVIQLARGEIDITGPPSNYTVPAPSDAKHEALVEQAPRPLASSFDDEGTNRSNLNAGTNLAVTRYCSTHILTDEERADAAAALRNAARK